MAPPGPPGYSDAPLWTVDGVKRMSLGGGLAVLEYAEDSALAAADARTGAERWRLERGAKIPGGERLLVSGIASVATADGSAVVVGTGIPGDGDRLTGVAALDAVTGAQTWEFTQAPDMWIDGGIDDSRYTAIAVSTIQGVHGVTVFDDRDGRELWSLERRDLMWVGDGIALVRPNNQPGVLTAHDLATGEKLWELSDAAFYKVKHADGAVVVLISRPTGMNDPDTARVLDARTGAELARFAPGGPGVGFCGSDGELTVCDLYDADSEERRFLIATREGVHVSPLTRESLTDPITVWRNRVYSVGVTMDVAGGRVTPELPGHVAATGDGYVAFTNGGTSFVVHSVT